jgi:hypothetical protein
VIQAVLEQHAQPFDLTKTRTWELCGAFTVAEPEPEYLVSDKDTLLQVLNELSTDHLAEVLDFALFVKARQAQQPDTDTTSEQSAQERHSPKSRYPLHSTVVHYDDPFMPVAQSDWEALR